MSLEDRIVDLIRTFSDFKTNVEKSLRQSISETNSFVQSIGPSIVVDNDFQKTITENVTDKSRRVHIYIRDLTVAPPEGGHIIDFPCLIEFSEKKVFFYTKDEVVFKVTSPNVWIRGGVHTLGSGGAPVTIVDCEAESKTIVSNLSFQTGISFTNANLMNVFEV